MFYNYFLRNFSVASIELALGSLLLGFGLVFGTVKWLQSAVNGVETTAGTVMLASLPIILGLQLLLAFIGYDVASTPRRAIHPVLAGRAGSRESVLARLAAAQPAEAGRRPERAAAD